MASVHLDGILDQVKALSSKEQYKLRTLLDDMLRISPTDTRSNAVDRALLETGLLREIKPMITNFKPYENRKPAKLKGGSKTASQIIIEERR